MIAVIDYDIGNISAVVNMLQRLGLSCCVTASAEEVSRAERIILPGNGAFDSCVKNLRASGLVPVLEKQVLQKGVPLLGICVGAQMLGRGSAEGVELGLGWLDMQVERLPTKPELRIPHMGWNQVAVEQAQHPLACNLDLNSRFYFVHSYYMLPSNSEDVLFRSYYGVEFAAGVARDNIVGVQFHPEKSHRFGKQFLNAFARWAV